MMQAQQIMAKVALIGNPNSGKTSVFNQLTGLNQRIGNYPGITVDKKTGVVKHGGAAVSVLDLPGIYSLYPKSVDEQIVFDILTDPTHQDYPDLAVVVADSSNLERNLLLFTQIYDLKIPVILALNMIDVSEKVGWDLDPGKLSELFGGVRVMRINAREGEGMDALRSALFEDLKAISHTPVLAGEFDDLDQTRARINDFESQRENSEKRYVRIRQMLGFARKRKADPAPSRWSPKIDRWVTHPVWGYVIFFAILFVMFQAIYAWAEWPMELIDNVFLAFSKVLKDSLPTGIFTNLLAEGIVPGLGGVVIFVPQIVLLFSFIVLLEETGYMARVVFLMDRMMRPFGLNGRSVVPLISGVACAIPAVMATRTIDNYRDRLLTILVTPLMSCSARLPVYTLLIALVIPDETLWGIIGLKGLALMSLYVLGLVAALLSALVFKAFVKTSQKGYLVMELPFYKAPRWMNMVITLTEKTKVFVWEAGKVIMAVSVILWVLASYGPSGRMHEAMAQVQPPEISGASQEEYEQVLSSVKLSNSYIGIMGKTIEPAIQPLGYNWQIGIALITSFAAREVFVGSIATIYSVGEDFEDNETLLGRMRTEVKASGEPLYSFASGLSLMVFYAFAMQCMSTLAIVYRETKSWKWPFIQLIYMTGLAYVCALLVYQILK
jgi:ferrous iron transport protein B